MSGLVISQGGLAEQSAGARRDVRLGEVLPTSGIPDRPADRPGERGL
jgi:hypothetical protein